MNFETNSENRRMCLLDEIRGIAVILMVIYHAFYSMTFIFHMEFSYTIMFAIMPFEIVIPATFIIISGIVSVYSRNNVQRGLNLFTIALLISLVTSIILPEQAILFGILHFLGIGLIIYSFFQDWLSKIPIELGLRLSLILFMVLYYLPNGMIGFPTLFSIKLPTELYSIYWLSFLGFPTPDFVSSDYFPIFPYIFLLFFGSFIGQYLKKVKTPEVLYSRLCPPLDFIGKHALLIYILHQPIIIGILFLISIF